LLNNVNALLYDLVPVDVADEQLKPNVFVALIYCPEYFFKFGLAPSKPPWNGRMNLRVDVATFVVNVPATNADCNEPEYAVVIVGKAEIGRAHV
jgi:hypothetical protein